MKYENILQLKVSNDNNIKLIHGYTLHISTSPSTKKKSSEKSVITITNYINYFDIIQ